VSRNHHRPGTVNVVHLDPQRHGENALGRGTAATMRWADGQLERVWGNWHDCPYESGIDTWALTCRCGKTVQASAPRWYEAARIPAGLTHFALDIMSL